MKEVVIEGIMLLSWVLDRMCVCICVGVGIGVCVCVGMCVFV